MSDKLTIVADQQITLAAELFSRFGEFRLVDGRHVCNEDIKDADVLLVRSVTQVNDELLDGSRVKFVGSATSGIDHVDIDYLNSRDIHFSHAPGSNARSVAEYVLSALLRLANEGQYSLSGKTMGIIGVGEVGSRVQQLMQSIGINCLLNDPPRQEREGGNTWSSLEALYKADIISCHTPLIESGAYATRELIDATFLNRLKQDVILINTSRGPVVNEVDLLKFMSTHPDASVVVDVWCNEPDINFELLQKADITTPHIAGYSQDGKFKATYQLLKSLCSWLSLPIAKVNGITAPDRKIELKTDKDFLFNAVIQSYDVFMDSQRLRAALELPASNRQAYFDALRKNYPTRREFGSYQLVTNGLTDTQKNVLKSVGFQQEG